MNSYEFFQKTHELTSRNTDFITCTLISIRGSAPQDPGSKMIVTKDGLYFGTVGGGKIENHCIQFAKQALLKNQIDFVQFPHLTTWNLQKDIGMSCGGEVTFLFEKFSSGKMKIAIFGAGHITQALTRVLQPLDCQITVIDPRQEWTGLLPTAQNIVTYTAIDPVPFISQFDCDTYFIVMTQGHSTDVPILNQILKTHPNPRFIGVIGSRVKAKKIRNELIGLGHTKSATEQIVSPLGLPFGANHPHEIAISIASQLIVVRDQISSLQSNNLSGTDNSSSAFSNSEMQFEGPELF